ncbi:hypothetical protein KAR48_18565 [bacterium]|nr:hypothetical protein [bacterium]
MHSLIWLAFFSGGGALATQILLLRQYWVTAHGNEWVFGIGLSAWLGWSALGSRLAVLQSKDSKILKYNLGLTLTLMALLIPASLFFFRSVRPLFSIPSGELIAPELLLVIAVIGFAPAAFGFGMLYTQICRLKSRYTGIVDAIQGTYFREAVGAGIAGLILSLWLLPLIPASTLILMLSIELIILSIIISHKRPATTTIRLILIAVLLYLSATRLIDIWSAPFDAPGQKISMRMQTRFNDLIMTKLQDQYTLYSNGVPAFTIPDQQSDEQTVHIPLLIHPHPAKVLLIGGNLCGSLREALKHETIENITLVEPDPGYIYITTQISPDSIKKILHNPRVTIELDDARHWISTVDRCFDVIIMNLPPPTNTQLNRFYTVEFFHLLKKHLVEGGLFAFNIQAAENALHPELAGFIAMLHNTLGKIFTHTLTLPGESILFAGSATLALENTNVELLISRINERQLKTQYVSEYFLPYQLSTDRVKQLNDQILTEKSTTLNTDWHPVGYLEAITYWNTQFSSDKYFTRNIGIIMTLLPLLLGISLFFLPSKKNHAILRSSVLIVGFTEMALQTTLIITYQTLIGQVYTHLGVITAAYMSGLAIGSHYTRKFNRNSSIQKFKQIEAGMSLLPLGILTIIYLLFKINASPWLCLISFSIMASAAGGLGGMQFPIANRLMIITAGKTDTIIGSLYALDLCGAMAGTLAITFWMLPVLGIAGTYLTLALFNTIIFISLSGRKFTF